MVMPFFASEGCKRNVSETSEVVRARAHTDFRFKEHIFYEPTEHKFGKIWNIAPVAKNALILRSSTAWKGQSDQELIEFWPN